MPGDDTSAASCLEHRRWIGVFDTFRNIQCVRFKKTRTEIAIVVFGYRTDKCSLLLAHGFSGIWRRGLTATCLRCAEWIVHIGTAIAIKLPVGAHFFELYEIQIRDNQLILVFASFSQDAPVGVRKVRRTEKLTDVPGRFGSDSVDSPNKVPVRHGVRALFKLPQIVGVPFCSCR